MRIRVLVLLIMMAATPAIARQATFDHTIPPGQNYDKAEFRLWVPPAAVEDAASRWWGRWCGCRCGR